VNVSLAAVDGDWFGIRKLSWSQTGGQAGLVTLVMMLEESLAFTYTGTNNTSAKTLFGVKKYLRLLK